MVLHLWTLDSGHRVGIDHVGCQIRCGRKIMNKRGNISNLIDFSAEVPGSETPRSPRAPRPPIHPSNCLCDACFKLACAYLDYLKAKKLYSENKF
jgi:hypothetical protein